MDLIQSYFTRFLQEEDAVTIVEMVIIVAVILILIIPALGELGTAEDEKLKELKDSISK
ncbi:pilus assembly protein [Brevibacillus sp. SYSU BS000544]|uniref:pilus assembly protein n=1 Tax=Brevibacillus sp. SYSU BS000544 TaxID=3416443 RepID=UPI003CE51E48